MIALIILLIVVLLLVWILFSPIELFIDTRIPIASIRWRTIGNFLIWFEHDEFWLKARIVFFEKEWCLNELKTNRKQKRTNKKKTRKTRALKILPRFGEMIKTFKIKECKVTFAPNDFPLAGQLYPLNYLRIPPLRGVSINFNGENYIVAKIVSVPWRMMFAFIRK